MATTRSLFHCIGTAVSLSTIPLIATVAVGAKVFYLVPLLIRWNFPLSEIPGPRLVSLPLLDLFGSEDSKLTREYFDVIQQEYGPVARVGLHHIVISDANIIEQVFSEAVENRDRDDGIVTVIAQSDTYVRGYRIPKGTIMTLVHETMAGKGQS